MCLYVFVCIYMYYYVCSWVLVAALSLLNLCCDMQDPWLCHLGSDSLTSD